jgi:carboxymethylenebutenolidase
VRVVGSEVRDRVVDLDLAAKQRTDRCPPFAEKVFAMPRLTASDFDQRLLDLYDDYAHGRLNRRDFAQRAAAFVAAGLTVESVLSSLLPNYALAEQVPADDPRVVAETFEYDSPQGGGKIKGLLARPAGKTESLPAVLVIHENRGLNPYIADVARRLAVSGFLALAPDALSPLGGYPGNDDDGRRLQSQRKPEEMTEDFVAGAKVLHTHPMSSGKVGAVGFCFGGGMVNQLAVRLPDILKAGVPFYGRQPAVEDVPKIKAALLIHYAGLDERINAGAAAYEAALKAAGVKYQAFVYPNVNHGFHNDSTPRYDEAAAKLAWERTIAFFQQELA